MTSIEPVVNRQILKWELEAERNESAEAERSRTSPVITISSQSGSRGSYFGSRLAQRLGYQRLNREAIDLLCNTPGYRDRVVAALDSHARRRLESQAKSIPTAELRDPTDNARHLCRVMLSMAELGGVVLMGRGGSFILGPKRGFHLRVVCPRARRVENLVQYKGLSAEEAARTIDRSDERRCRFVADLFNQEIDNPRQYDMVVNSALIDVEDMVEVVVTALQAKISKLTHLDHDRP